MLLVYLPHLDYDHQRFGPDRAGVGQGRASSSTTCSGDLIDHARVARRPGRGAERVRHHRRQAPGRDQPRAAPRRTAERLHPGRHGVPGPVDLARVRGRRPPDRPRLRRRPGRHPARARGDRRRWTASARCWRASPWPPRASTTSAPASSSSLAERDAWFTYHYWLDNAHAPDFGQQVEIHRKPGYDPAELFWDPDDEKGAKLRGGLALARKKARHALRAVAWSAWTRPSTSRAPTACCRTTTWTRRCSCARRSRSRATAWRPRTSATCCWTWRACASPPRVSLTLLAAAVTASRPRRPRQARPSLVVSRARGRA